MDSITAKAFPHKTTWYAKATEDGAGDKTYADPVTNIPCLIDGRAVVTISNKSSRATLYVASRDSGESIQAKYLVYIDYTTYPIQERDDLIVFGRRYPVIGIDHYGVLKKGQHELGVIYL